MCNSKQILDSEDEADSDYSEMDDGGDLQSDFVNLSFL